MDPDVLRYAFEARQVPNRLDEIVLKHLIDGCRPYRQHVRDRLPRLLLDPHALQGFTGPHR